MKGTHEFIVKIENEFSDTFKTEGGLELYADARFSKDRLATRIVDVIEIPLFYDGPIKKGDQVYIDKTIFLHTETERHGKVENPYNIDQKKGLYKIGSDLIYLYRSNEEDTWKANNDSVFIEATENFTDEVKVGSIIIEQSKPAPKNKYKVLYSNNDAIEYGIKPGKKVIINEKYKLPIPLDGKDVFQLRTKDILAIYKD